MKRTGRILCSVLLLASLILQLLPAGAESASNSWGNADILKLMNERNVPSITSIDFESNTLSLGNVTSRQYSQDLVSSNGDVLNVKFEFELRETMSDAQWQTVTDWLKALVLSAVQSVKADSESLANVLSIAYKQQRASAQPGETGMPVWTSSALVLKRITATVPYYPVLSVGINGTATQKLQEKLIELGFLNDNADGYYGTNTQEAVKRLETYIRQLEQDVPRLPQTDEGLTSGLSTLFSKPTEMPVVTDELIEPDSNTQVDGVADILLQAYLYSDDFTTTRENATIGDYGMTPARIQTRLANLGYLTGEVDGNYGSGTAYSLRLFQYYNGLPQTGVADIETQKVLFSSRAVKPDHSMLTVGNSGDEVSRLQRRLRILGFGNISVDGSYGVSTKTGVENLQQYMQALGMLDGMVEINGIADPILLDAFYNASFPELPDAMAPGSSGANVVRLQRRLNCLEYYYSTVDGDYGEGTASAVKSFQKLNGLSQTGQADARTLAKLFSADAQKSLKPYLLRVSRKDQRVYAYALDSNLQYTDLVKTMKCSTGRSGSETPAGTYTNTTGPGARWHYFTKFDCWAQYAYYIQGDIMFHSVLYGSKEGRVTQSSVNNLGRKASHGCVRLAVEDAKWIWTNCPTHTTVIVE